MMRSSLLAGFVAWASCFALSAFAQVPEPLPQPNLALYTNGTVGAVAKLPDGSVVIGGHFTTVNGTPRSNIAKLLSDGRLDPNWNPSASQDIYPSESAVLALAADAAGNVYVGGAFTNIGGQARNHIAKLSSSGTGAADETWDPAANEVVVALAVDTTGNVFAGGLFTNIGGRARNYIAKLSGTGTGTADLEFAGQSQSNGACDKRCR